MKNLFEEVKLGHIMNENRGFKSYIDHDEQELETLSLDDVHAKLMPGEALVAEAQGVIMFPPMEQREDILGVLSVTNFKFSFIPYKQVETCSAHRQQNLLLGDYEMCLLAIDAVYQTGDKKRKLTPGQSVSGKVKGLLVVCKNMRVMSFSFKNCTVDSGKTITNAILHHAFLKRHPLLFAYDYKEDYYSILSNVILFSHQRDWKKEMERTRCQNWRVSIGNQEFNHSQNLPQIVVVPNSLTDGQLARAAEHFQNYFYPVWVWSPKNGAALIRMADIVPTIVDRTQENIMLEHVRKSHPKKSQPQIIDLTKECPLPKDVQMSYLRLRDLCTPTSARQFWLQDEKMCSLLEGSRWLHYVSQSLAKSVQAAEFLQNGTTVALQEGGGQDMCCVVSCLTQLLLDPYWRTTKGFQSLVQKEWVYLGHPFSKRLGHVTTSDVEQSPLFLLFLDCVWQLLQQYPQAFEFSETYLTTLWDSVHVSVFDTFLFDNEHHRFMAVNDRMNPLRCRSVWDWGEQFLDKDRDLFASPFFDEKFKDRLQPQYKVCHLELWGQCYLRWIPFLEIAGGGRPQIDLRNRLIVSEIQLMKQQLEEGESQISHVNGKRDDYDFQVNSFFPFGSSGRMSGLHGVLTLNSNLLVSEIDSQSIVNAPD